MEQTRDEFFHDFRQELLAGSEANGSFQLSEFMETIANELIDTGFTEGFELCHFRAQRGMRVDGYWFNDDGVLDLFIADFDSRNELASLSKAEVAVAFRRVSSFYEASICKNLAAKLEVTSPEYGLAKQITDRKDTIRQLNLILLSERILSEKIQGIPDTKIVGIPAIHQIWDISRLHRQRSSRSHKEPLDLDFEYMFGKGIACLPAHLGTDSYQSYLMVMPGEVLATLYERFGARLLEQNVRTFLQARGNVNQGIRATILNEAGMFFAYNNGITATAQDVEAVMKDSCLEITRIVDLQIVNGGQTTASLFHTWKRDNADLSQIFVQMKLSVIDGQQGEMVIPKISEYANTQNRVNAADFFSNHPFHVRMEGFSRRIWAPAQKGAQRETRWFYERARGQYADAQSKLTSAEQRRFKAEHPKLQMFTKTDLAKFENVWGDHPRWVNLGSQKNFARYAARIGSEWEKSSDTFNEFYFKRAVARGIIFRATERIISAQPWYNGGYRANILAYTLAMLGNITKFRKEEIDFLEVWNTQKIDPFFEAAIAVVAGMVKDDIMRPPHGISNISEWCKKEACWIRIQERTEAIEECLSLEFLDRLISLDTHVSAVRTAKQTQRIDDGIEAQRKVLSISAAKWAYINQTLHEKGVLTPKEDGVLKIAMLMPIKIPTDKQSLILLDILDKGRREGIAVNEY
ncbi:TPA: AIPR family protein [Yersinia enterocolitica]|uniref:AIPR family protein n=1 Tax=Yersinia enterocolitica TaxID=630 RepID=UPI0005E7E1A9|nr:AIPR family protein [Yersinia enterocolitica]CQH44194.1 AIPR protein [Yersinia enterocolitica]HDL8537600.1 AIPR family protein [Yersinia enterocolitica]HDL8752787.1 AIPR family protein [Yersinia enterocolitica]